MSLSPALRVSRPQSEYVRYQADIMTVKLTPAAAEADAGLTRTSGVWTPKANDLYALY